MSNSNMITLYHGSIHDFDRIDVSRGKPNTRHGYDVVIGPTANDDTLIMISALLNRTYGDPKSDRAKEIFLEFILVSDWRFRPHLRSDRGNKYYRLAFMENSNARRYILADKLPHQIFFGTEKAASFLSFKDRRIVP